MSWNKSSNYNKMHGATIKKYTLLYFRLTIISWETEI